MSTWPPAEGLLTPTTPRANAVIALSASIDIAAPAALVFEILRQTDKYPDWNTWCPKVVIQSQPAGTPADSTYLVLGTRYDLCAVMDLSKPDKATPTRLVITDLSTPDAPTSEYLASAQLLEDPTFTRDLSRVYRIAWKGDGGFQRMGLQTERFHEVLVKGEGACEVRTWEVMGGALAYTVKWMFRANLEGKFKLWVGDLKKRAEALHAAGTGAGDSAA